MTKITPKHCATTYIRFKYLFLKLSTVKLENS